MNIKTLIKDAAIVIVSGIIGYFVVQAIITKEKSGNKKVQADEAIKISYDNTSRAAKTSITSPSKNILYSECKPRKLLYSVLSSINASNLNTTNSTSKKYEQLRRELENSSLTLLKIESFNDKSKENTNDFRNAILSQDYNEALAIMVRSSGIPSAISEAILLRGSNIPEDIVREMALINKAVSFADINSLSAHEYSATLLNDIYPYVTSTYIQKTWFDGNRYASLATESLARGNGDLMEFWIAKGSPFNNVILLEDALNRLSSSNTDKAEIARTTEVVKNYIDPQNSPEIALKLRLIEASLNVTDIEDESKTKENANCTFEGLGFTSEEEYVQSFIDRDKNKQFIEERLHTSNVKFESLAQFPVEANKMFGLASEKSWEEAYIAALTVFELSNKTDILNIAVEIFLFEGAPEHYIDQLIEAGGYFSPATAHHIVKQKTPELLKILDKHNFDFSFVKNGISLELLAKYYGLELSEEYASLIAQSKVEYDPRGLTPDDYEFLGKLHSFN